METDDQVRGDLVVDEEIKPCLSCMAPNPASAEFCVDCGQPLDGGNVLTPMGTVRSEAKMWGGVLPGHKEERRPTKLKLAVVWIILLPLMLTSGVFAMQQIYIRAGLLSFVVFWLGVVIVAFSASGLYRVTRDYLKISDPADVEELP